jgi:AraC-like DNA-binding protein
MRSVRTMSASTTRKQPPAATLNAGPSLAIDDPSGPMAIRFVSLRQNDRPRLVGGGAVIVAPMRTGTVTVTVAGSDFAIDRNTWMLVPAREHALLRAEGPIAHALVLGVLPELVVRLTNTYPDLIDASSYETLVRTPRVLSRSTWVGELFHRYLFERAVCRHRDNDATRFLETELAKELYFACRDRDRDACRTSPPLGRSPTVQRALEHIEEHLFEPDVLRHLSKASAASSSTLLRSFKREVGAVPLIYVRTRRLEEARLLLSSGRRTVSEVALAVGYKSFAAFSQAFRARFGVRPSDVAASTR